MSEIKNELVVPEKEKTEENICFIITPIGDDNSAERRKADGVIKTVLKPILEKEPYKFKVIVAHEITETGSITNQVFECVVNSKLVIANVTKLNPNVMYELGVRHAVARPVITIFEEGTSLPFDISADRSIKYVNDMHGVADLKERLIPMIDSIKYDEPVKDNPVLNALKDSALIRNMSGEDKEQQMLLRIYERLEQIEDKIIYDKRHRNINIENNKFNRRSDYHVIVVISNNQNSTKYYKNIFETEFFASALEINGVFVDSDLLMINLKYFDSKLDYIRNIIEKVMKKYDIKFIRIDVEKI